VGCGTSVYFSVKIDLRIPLFLPFILVDDYSFYPGPCFSSSLSLFSGCFGF